MDFFINLNNKSVLFSSVTNELRFEVLPFEMNLETFFKEANKIEISEEMCLYSENKNLLNIKDLKVLTPNFSNWIHYHLNYRNDKIIFEPCDFQRLLGTLRILSRIQNIKYEFSEDMKNRIFPSVLIITKGKMSNNEKQNINYIALLLNKFKTLLDILHQEQISFDGYEPDFHNREDKFIIDPILKYRKNFRQLKISFKKAKIEFKK
jgi:hypothetical protein